ncbi:GDP-L-fucose synthase [Amylibacter ulvae]|uniref:GDP-L-fucose synthase n=1 Tax=Paramylibacter ulvae TaxID=1651968 RepID=A0ABQ3D1G4_9RHOB|nr:NAD-dependent epimerase/dehydratase family protein [Amylibacter ulvae]GHA48619.1 GDP-L-fucose synthase [Amylibacter ulvae]
MRILLTGGSGMLGQSLRDIAAREFPDHEIVAPTRSQLMLTDRSAVANFMENGGFDAVIHGAARVGGIQANIAHPVEFLAQNLQMNDAVIMGAYEAKIERLFFLGSSCMYPKDYKQPLKEDYILQAPLEPTNEGYALSKITGARLCEYISVQRGYAYKTLIPCNLFGENDHFGSDASHLIAAIVTKISDAVNNDKDTVEIWGSGKARREFLLVDDLARFILQNIDKGHNLPAYLNTGYGHDHSVFEYYQMIAGLFSFKGEFTFDISKPEGMMAKLMDSSIAKEHGWGPVTPINQALEQIVHKFQMQTQD